MDELTQRFETLQGHLTPSSVVSPLGDSLQLPVSPVASATEDSGVNESRKVETTLEDIEIATQSLNP